MKLQINEEDIIIGPNINEHMVLIHHKQSMVFEILHQS